MLYIYTFYIYISYIHGMYPSHSCLNHQSKKEKQRLVHGLAGAVDLPRHRSRCLVARDDGLVIFRVIAIDSD